MFHYFTQHDSVPHSQLPFSQGKSEFIGRTMAKPVVKMSNEKYESPNFPPHLEWHDVFRGEDKAGELLATFELLQVCLRLFYWLALLVS